MRPRQILTISAVILLAVIFFVPRILYYSSIPRTHTALTRFDTLIVLGYPSNPDGSPSPEQRERVLEAIREYRRGVAPAIIMTGGAAHNTAVEATSMRHLAIDQSVPPGAVIEEPRAQDTIQNIFYSSQIMAAHHWRSAEVISSPSHLSRAALILQHYPFAWTTHASRWPHEYNPLRVLAGYWVEIQHCWQIRNHGFPPNALFPRG